MKPRTYKPLILWCIIFFTSMILLAYLTESLNLDTSISIKIICIYILASIEALLLLIHFGDYVYYFTGNPTYEQACKATLEQRKSFTLAHVKVFGKMGLLLLVYYLISFLFNFNFALDTIALTLGIVIAALSTIKLKWDLKKGGSHGETK